MGDAYGGLRLRIANVSNLIKDIGDRIVIMSKRIKDVEHHTANVSDRIKNVSQYGSESICSSAL